MEEKQYRIVVVNRRKPLVWGMIILAATMLFIASCLTLNYGSTLVPRTESTLIETVTDSSCVGNSQHTLYIQPSHGSSEVQIVHKTTFDAYLAGADEWGNIHDNIIGIACLIFVVYLICGVAALIFGICILIVWTKDGK